MLREDAYRVVQESAMRAWQEGLDFGALQRVARAAMSEDYTPPLTRAAHRRADSSSPAERLSFASPDRHHGGPAHGSVASIAPISLSRDPSGGGAEVPWHSAIAITPKYATTRGCAAAAVHR
jgi:hypothetical protein